MINSVDNYAISSLFNIDENVIYTIPRYQREYTWTKKHWESLFDDLLENDSGYFLGSIICINQNRDALQADNLEVVDGQQRLITISVLIAAIFKRLRQDADEADDDQLVERTNLKHKLVLKKAKQQIRVVPQVQNRNHDDYRGILSEIGAITGSETPANAGNRRIFKAFRYFEKRISKMLEGKLDGRDLISTLVDKVNQASMVKIEVASHADAYTLFESLNDRGEPLTAIDLLKNKLLAQLDRDDKGNIDDYFQQWNKLLEYLGESYAEQERFFRHYFNAFKADLREDMGATSSKDIPLATRSNLIQIYEKLIESDARKCLDGLLAAGRIYTQILFPDQDAAGKALEKPLKGLERIQGSPSYLLILYLLARREKLKLTSSQLSAIIELLVRFFVRRNLTDSPPTNSLTRLFPTIITILHDKAGDDVVKAIHRELVAVSSPDDEFKRRLEGSIYDENAGVTRFILCALAEKGMTRETVTDLWRTENKQLVWTIEHILPQGEHLPEPWIEMIAAGDRDLAKEYQQKFAHKLGNLTISGYNSSLGNKRFDEKRDRKDSEDRYVGYKNGLVLNEDLKSADQWSIRQIEERGIKLVAETLQLFSLDDSLS